MRTGSPANSSLETPNSTILVRLNSSSLRAPLSPEISGRMRHTCGGSFGQSLLLDLFTHGRMSPFQREEKTPKTKKRIPSPNFIPACGNVPEGKLYPPPEIFKSATYHQP